MHEADKAIAAADSAPPSALMVARRRHGPRQSAPKRHRSSEATLGYLMIGPVVLMISLLAVLPVAITVTRSLYEINPTVGVDRFAWFKNYVNLFTDPELRIAFFNTALYVLFGVGLSMALALAFAIALQRKVRASGLLLALAMLPWALPSVVAGVIWGWIYSPSSGVLNSFLTSIHVISKPILWVGTDPLREILAISVVGIWQFTPLATIIILASLQGIPKDLYEAADIDGASGWTKVWRISIPLARPGITIALVEAIIVSATIFDPVYVLNQNALSGESLVSTIYYTTFQSLNFGQGYAFSMVLTIGVVVISGIAAAVTYKRTDV